MASNVRPNILLFGTGSVGAIYLYLLSEKADTVAICRSNYDTVIRDGFTINSQIFGQGLKVHPKVARSCGEAISQASRPFDYVLVTSKVVPGVIPMAIAPAVTPGHTAIVLLQNGVGIEDEYYTAFPKNPIISAVVYLPVTQDPPGTVTHGEIELLEVGAYPESAPNDAAAVFVNLIKAAGGTAELHSNVQTKRWFKLLVNASWNPICALTLSKDTDVLSSTSFAAPVIRAIMLEIRDIAAAYGHEISVEQVDFQLGRALARVPRDAGIVPSMLQDVREGRRLEVEAILGNALRMAREKGVKCERLEVLYVLGKALDGQIGRR